MSVLDGFGLLGTLGVGVAMVVLGLLSRRFGAATRAAPRYRGFYIAASFLFVSAALQMLNFLIAHTAADALLESPLWLIVYQILPAVGVTIGLVQTWHYWSWLLAESG